MTCTLEIGTFKSLNDAKAALEKAGVKHEGFWTSAIVLPHIVFESVPREIEIKCIRPCDLGLKPGSLVREIYAAAAVAGLKTPPPETAVHLFLQWPDYFGLGGEATLGMKPVVVNDDNYFMFRVRHLPEGRILSSGPYGHPNLPYRNDTYWIFQKI